MKLSYVAALLLAAFFYLFSIYFPSYQNVSRIHIASVLISVGALTLALVAPGTLAQAIVQHEWGKEVILEPILWSAFAALFLVLFVGGGVRLLVKSFIQSGKERIQATVISGAVMLAGVFGIYYNLILASPFFQNFQYIWSGPVFTFAFAGIMTYAIFKHQFFNPKAVLAELLVYAMLIVIFIRMLAAESMGAVWVDGALLAIVVPLGFLLIRSVHKEISQREQIERQEHELEQVNRQQENLLHFMSHEIKGYLTEGQNAFAAIVEGDFGVAPPKVQEIAKTALIQMRKGVGTVMDILDASNLKRGTVSFESVSFDVREAVSGIVQELKPMAAEKGLTLDISHDNTSPLQLSGDREKLRRHVFRNLIDNAIRYTQKGSVHVTLARRGDGIVFSVKDTGVGITEDDKKRLFTEGGHGKDSIKINVHSTGYGLFIAKQIVDAHHGRIRAESAGAGEGSEFIVELPLGNVDAHS